MLDNILFTSKSEVERDFVFDCLVSYIKSRYHDKIAYDYKNELYRILFVPSEYCDVETIKRDCCEFESFCRQFDWAYNRLHNKFNESKEKISQGG